MNNKMKMTTGMLDYLQQAFEEMDDDLPMIASPTIVLDLIEDIRKSRRVTEYFLRQKKEIWRHYKAALEYAEGEES